MPITPDLQALHRAAAEVDGTAAIVEVDVAAIDRLVDGLPWRGPRRDVVVRSAKAGVGTARGQAAAERQLARALRQLAVDVEHELLVLRALADRARRHLEDLLRQARAVVEVTAAAVADAAAAAVGRVLVEVVTGDPVGALREARRLAEEAADRMRSIALRLQGLPDPSDPAWRRLGPEILAWRP